MERSVQAFEVAEESESASCGAVEEAMLRVKRGVVVPSPSVPVAESKMKPDVPALPKMMVEDA